MIKLYKVFVILFLISLSSCKYEEIHLPNFIDDFQFRIIDKNTNELISQQDSVSYNNVTLHGRFDLSEALSSLNKRKMSRSKGMEDLTHQIKNITVYSVYDYNDNYSNGSMIDSILYTTQDYGTNIWNGNTESVIYLNDILDMWFYLVEIDEKKLYLDFYFFLEEPPEYSSNQSFMVDVNFYDGTYLSDTTNTVFLLNNDTQ